MRRGKMAMNNNMTGSARQYFEKALTTLDNQSYTDEYITTRRAELESMLEKITQELKSANASSVKKKLEEEKDDLDELFAPKKKW
jgi:type II secretory pathway predicted ATPase ExeA